MSTRRRQKQKRMLLNIDPTYSACPKCGKVNVLRRSRSRTFFEKLLRYTSIFKMYRCRSCGWRGSKSVVIITVQTIKNLLLYIIAALVSAYVVHYFLKNSNIH